MFIAIIVHACTGCVVCEETMAASVKSYLTTVLVIKTKWQFDTVLQPVPHSLTQLRMCQMLISEKFRKSQNKLICNTLPVKHKCINLTTDIVAKTDSLHLNFTFHHTKL